MEHKADKQWVWLALDASTGEIIGVYLGARDEKGAPTVYGTPYHLPIASVQLLTRTFGSAYATVLPSKRHRALGQETRKTGDIER